MTRHLETLKIVELDADDPAAVDAAYRITNDAMLADLPDLPPNCRFAHEMRLRVPMPANKRHTFLGYRGEEPVAVVDLNLPVYDNLDKAHVDVVVPAGLRRQGVGRALYAHAVDVAKAKGRTSVLCFGPLGSGPFAEAMGLRNGLVDARRRLTLATVDEAALDRLLAQGRERARGYSLVRWGNMPPEELLVDLAALDSSFVAESPMGELDYEPEKVDADRLRRQYEVRERYGARSYETGVVHDETGQVVAWSALRVAKTVDWHAWQQITLVHPKHRGHRLGIVAKIENLRSMRESEPAVRVVDTFNAEVNSHMIAINEAMGFRYRESWGNWQGPVG